MITDQPLPHIEPDGKFLRRLDQKFFFKAMRLHVLEAPPQSLDFAGKVALRKRLDDLKAGHTTGLILTEAQAEPVLGVAAQSGLYALMEIEVAPDVLLTRAAYRAALVRLTGIARAFKAYPALIGYLINCPIEAAIVRTRGLKCVKHQFEGLIAALRRGDDRRIVSLKHRPAVSALASLQEDLVYAALPPLAPSDLNRYLIKLHNLAEARPVIIEFGEGLPGQDELVACAFGLGAAGVVAPAMRPAASPGLMAVRMLSAGEFLPFVSLNGSCPPLPAVQPMVSVVICAYNAERTMLPCLESLRRLQYPNFEVIIVDDGSRDRTAAISAEFPEFRLIRQPNKGLSVARNVGLHAARGEIIAYTDSDCVVDPHWLSMMVRAMTDGGFDGCGGPNYAPHEEGWVEGCVAASPGAPSHVLTGDDRAEHLAGCNMFFRKAALAQIDGFDAQFTAAGDDVDICWRMLDAGFTLGYCPAAFVWHFRRNTVKAYYGQQRGYGKAEAMLYLKYPERFNALGQVKWRGIIPSIARTFPGGERIRARWSHSPEMQQVEAGSLSLACVLPLTAEWNLGALALLAFSFALGVTLIPALAILTAGPLWALYYARHAKIEKCHEGFFARLFVALLAWTGPMERTYARWRYRGAVARNAAIDLPARQRPSISWLRRTVTLAYWNENYTVREALLEKAGRLFARMGHPAVAAQGWQDIDLALNPDRWVRLELKTADEEHPGSKVKTMVAARIRLSALTRTGLGLGAAATITATVFGAANVAAVLGAVTAGSALCAVSEVIAAGRMAYRVIEQCAEELELTPLGKLVRHRPSAAIAPSMPRLEAESQAEIGQPS
jgi:O-antigen biosynthesis protein